MLIFTDGVKIIESHFVAAYDMKFYEWVDKMKKFVLFAVVGLIFFSQSAVLAYSRYIPLTNLDRIIGNWYDSKGNLALTISKDYKINGCKVIAAFAYDFDLNHRPHAFSPGRQLICDEVYRIVEKNGYRDIEFDSIGHGYFKILVVDGKIILYNTVNPQHFESVGGIYLGMNKNKIVPIYGKPSSIKPANLNQQYGNEIWKYEEEGMEIKFFEDFVFEIKIYAKGNRHFDVTGLSCRDPLKSFVEKYPRLQKLLGNKKPEYLKGRWEGSSALPIGNGEAINFGKYPESITLEINDWYKD